MAGYIEERQHVPFSWHWDSLQQSKYLAIREKLEHEEVTDYFVDMSNSP